MMLLVFSLASIAVADPQAPFEISVEDINSARLGDNVQVSISQISGTETYASFHFVVAYNPNVLRLTDAQEGYVPGVCGWEVFSYDSLPCDSCDWQVVEITGIADDSGTPGTPSCYSDFGDLVVMTFKVLPVPANAGSYAEINFYWSDCESNVVKSAGADTTWYGKFAYDHFGNDITGSDPNFGGVMSGCIIPNGDVPIRAVNTHNGGIQISADYGVYGDLNGDGHFNISDITYLINYIFFDGSAPRDFLKGDYDGDDMATISDAVFLMNYLFMLMNQ